MLPLDTSIGSHLLISGGGVEGTIPPQCLCSCTNFLKSENSNIASEFIDRLVTQGFTGRGPRERHTSAKVSMRGHPLERLKLERTRDILIGAMERQSPPPVIGEYQRWNCRGRIRGTIMHHQEAE